MGDERGGGRGEIPRFLIPLRCAVDETLQNQDHIGCSRSSMKGAPEALPCRER